VSRRKPYENYSEKKKVCSESAVTETGAAAGTKLSGFQNLLPFEFIRGYPRDAESLAPAHQEMSARQSRVVEVPVSHLDRLELAEW
jgi:hypothetical protein